MTVQYFSTKIFTYVQPIWVDRLYGEPAYNNMQMYIIIYKQ